MCGSLNQHITIKCTLNKTKHLTVNYKFYTNLNLILLSTQKWCEIFKISIKMENPNKWNKNSMSNSKGILIPSLLWKISSY